MRFVGPDGWDPTVPGLFYARVSERFPTRQQISAIEASVVTDPGAGGLQQALVPVERVRLMRRDGAAAINVGPHYLSVSRTQPYQGWEEFGPMIAEALSDYREIATPSNLQRVGLRYVNQIQFPPRMTIELSTYFDFFPHLGERLPQNHANSVCGVQIPYDDDRDLLRVQLPDQPPSPDATTMLLDLDYFLTKARHVTFDEIPGWLDIAHGRLEQVFEGVIRDELRAQFKPVEISS